MRIHAVVGGSGAGSTATVVNLVATLRREGHHAVALDLSGDVADLFNVETTGTVAGVLSATDSVDDATVTVNLDPDDVEDALRDYHEGTQNPDRSFRASPAETDDAATPDPGSLPVLVGGSREAIGDADRTAMSDLVADLGFAYDHVVVDAGSLDAAVGRLADGVITVTTPDDDAVATAVDLVSAVSDSDGTVVGSVVNRATDATDVSGLQDRLGTEILAVVPVDSRTQAVEPVAFAAPETPVGAAYGRLAAAVLNWDESTGLVDGGPATDVAANDGDEDDEESSGLLGRLF